MAASLRKGVADKNRLAVPLHGHDDVVLAAFGPTAALCAGGAPRGEVRTLHCEAKERSEAIRARLAATAENQPRP